MGVTRRDVVKGAMTAGITAGPLAQGISALAGQDGTAAGEGAATGQREAAMQNMRTRYLTRLNDFEIRDYLKRNDVLFIPVGTVEIHGVMPVDCEYVLPLGYAVEMAKQTDGLVLPHMAYFYPGGTAIGEGTVHISPSAGKAYLMEICRSLMRQGFRRQVLLTAHGPSLVTAMPLVREFFDETKCPIGYVDLLTRFSSARDSGIAASFNVMMWGAYSIIGALDDVHPYPVAVRREPFPQPVADIHASGAYAGWFFDDETQHGWFPTTELSPQEREERAAEGVEQIKAVIEHMDVPNILDTLRRLDEFTQREVMPQYGEILP